MIAFGLLAVISATTEAPPVSGDFDGDGLSDTAAIVRQPDGRRDVVAVLHDGRRFVVYARVDEAATLGLIPPPEIARLCGSYAGAVPACSRQFAGRDRDALTFIPDVGGVPALAMWNGTRFFALQSTWSPRTTPASTLIGAVPSSVRAPARAAQLPCKLKDGRGRLVEVDPLVCQALADNVERGAKRPNERSSHTGLQVQVDETGRVERCQVIEASGTPELDAKACSIAIERARYAPGPNGGPMKRQTRRIRITWPQNGAPLAVGEG
ncbi:TonB family protein [Sphingomonas sp. RIT328]|uniref:TonB family protein n=1 Tax=Sphingomonas sp. RIT328 TaxID=1470591 RepID=UPI000449A6C6|nr:TonB family protein [Sphingomonas sp. RIT328]EZP50050.1 TonB family protein [Sphingomonas sp. RIT328]